MTLTSCRLCRERYRPRSRERHAEAGEHGQVGVKRDPLDATDTEGSQPVTVLQAPELSFDGSAAPVEVFPPLGVRASNVISGKNRRRSSASLGCCRRRKTMETHTRRS
jgi:hypothetical protein